MLGNVCEWCIDWYSPYSSGAAVDPVRRVGFRNAVVRGGCWAYHPRDLRCANRSYSDVSIPLAHVGFRLIVVMR